MSDLITWSNEKERRVAIAEYSAAISAFDGIPHTSASIGRTFLDVEGNKSIRSEYNRSDYYRYRRGEKITYNQQEELIRLAMTAYDKVGVVRNVIDLMADFACQGIRLTHVNENKEKFFQRWFDKVNGRERSERFLNYLYRTGNVIVRRFEGNLPPATEKEMNKIHGSDVELEEIVVRARRIPLRYVFYSPLALEVIGGDLAAFMGKPVLALKINSAFRLMLSRLEALKAKNKANLGDIPPELKQAALRGERLFVLPQDELSIFYYKKDDWNVWANPMLAAIMDDLVAFEKMKLADISALDGAISNVRLWNLGYIDEKTGVNSILPTKAGIEKLRNILASNVGGGTIDLVWGPELKFTESATQVHHFLGPAKYEPCMNNIYDGLGVPQTLTSSNANTGFTNNFLSLKTLIERLEYGRNLLKNFWVGEIKRVQKAMGFRFPAYIEFEHMTLSDEEAEKNLWIQLADRDIISHRSLQEKFGITPEVEKIRIKKEIKLRGETLPAKASPYHNPQIEDELKKVVFSKGTVTPSEIGLELLPRKKGEKTPNDDMIKMQKDKLVQQQKFKPSTPGGRPSGKKDSSKRKTKRVTPRSSAEIENYSNRLLWTQLAQKTIQREVGPALLHALGKKDQRSLTKDEVQQFERAKFMILCNLEPYEELTKGSLYEALQGPDNAEIEAVYHQVFATFVSLNERQPTINELREIQANAYTCYFDEDI